MKFIPNRSKHPLDRKGNLLLDKLNFFMNDTLTPVTGYDRDLYPTEEDLKNFFH